MSTKLRNRQLKAARLLAYGETATEVARQLKLCRKTLSRWRKIPEFNTEIDKVTQEEHAGMRYRFSTLAGAAVAAVWGELKYSFDNESKLKTALSVLKLLGIERVTAPDAPAAGEDAP